MSSVSTHAWRAIPVGLILAGGLAVSGCAFDPGYRTSFAPPPAHAAYYDPGPGAVAYPLFHGRVMWAGRVYEGPIAYRDDRGRREYFVAGAWRLAAPY